MEGRGAAQPRRPDPATPLLPYGAATRGARCSPGRFVTRSGVKEVSFLPMMIDESYRPEVLRQGDPRFDDMVGYMEWVSEGFDHRFTVRGDEVVVTAAEEAVGRAA